MTPAERARQIDKEEFEAECTAIRQRAFAYAEQCRAEARSQAREWITGKPAVVVSFSRSGRPEHAHTVNGAVRTLKQWAKHLGISKVTLLRRRRELGSLEAAIAMGGPQRRRHAPGVVSNFAPSKGTGAGSTAQETPNLTFSQEAAE